MRAVVHDLWDSLAPTHPAEDLLDKYRICPLGVLTAEAVILYRIARDEHHLPYPGAIQDQPAWYGEARGIVGEVQALHEWRQMQPTTTTERRPPGG